MPEFIARTNLSAAILETKSFVRIVVAFRPVVVRIDAEFANSFAHDALVHHRRGSRAADIAVMSDEQGDDLTPLPVSDEIVLPLLVRFFSEVWKRKVVGANEGSLRERHRAYHDAFKLAHVAGPFIKAEFV